ncbi:hypothetical protein ACFL2Q_14425 [Thermodesulfobacteriota bacterium]
MVRFAILCNGTEIKEWELNCVKHLLKFEGTQLAAILIEDGARSNTNGARRSLQSGRCLLFRLFARIFVRPTAFRTRLLNGHFPDVPMLRSPGPNRNVRDSSGHPAEKDALRELGLDFILSFGTFQGQPGLSDITRWGVWSFHPIAVNSQGVGEPLFHEVLEGLDTACVVLQAAIGPNTQPVELKRGRMGIDKTSYSETLNNVFTEISKWPAFVTKRILLTGLEPTDSPSSPEDVAVTEVPTNLTTLSFIASLAKGLLGSKYDSLFRHERWNIGIARSPIESFLDSSVMPDIGYLPEPAGKTVFRADPFGIWEEDKLTLMFEEFDYRDPKGYIACSEMVSGLSRSTSRVVFREPFHMSYPYLFRHEGDIYCVPETGENRTIELLRAVDFPLRWTKIVDLAEDVGGTDSTLFQYGGLWWLAYTDSDHDANLNLFLRYSHQLGGPWQPHAANPVKTDIRSARPAGTPFMHKYRLYRPSQDCSESYGGRVVINRIDKLTPEAFEEVPVAFVEPDKDGPYPDGLHTISSVGSVTLVDGLRLTFIPAVFCERLFGRIGKTVAGFKRVLSTSGNQRTRG